MTILASYSPLVLFIVLILLITIILFCCIVFNKNINTNVKYASLKYIIVAYAFNILLKAPMHFFCVLLDVMLFYYIWCGIVGCMVIFIISNLKDNHDCNNGWWYIKRFFFITFLLALYANILSIIMLLSLCIIIPNHLQLILSTFWEKHNEHLILHVDDNRIIIPEDPFNQLSTGYSKNGTNQPIGNNIAYLMEIRYNTYGTILTNTMLPANVQRFILSYLYEHDRLRYTRVMRGVTAHNGKTPKWAKLGNISPIREGLRNLP